MTKNLKGLMNALRQSINEAILESDDVAAAMAALKLSGECPVFTVDIALEDAPAPAADPGVARGLSEELVLDDLDVTFLAAMGIVDPSWCSTPEPARRGVE